MSGGDLSHSDLTKINWNRTTPEAFASSLILQKHALAKWFEWPWPHFLCRRKAQWLQTFLSEYTGHRLKPTGYTWTLGTFWNLFQSNETKMQKNQKKDKNADKQKKEYEPFRWQIVAILINFAPRPKTIEHSTSLFCFQNSLQPWIFTMAGLTLKASSLEKIFFGTHLEHRMRLHIGKRHCDEWIVHHCKPKDGGWQEKI